MVSSPFASSPNAFPPSVCGILSGQHMYFESGDTGQDAGSVTVEKNAANFGRRFKIKVTYIEECNPLRPPSGCTQFFTGTSSTIQSYNYEGRQLLENQLYSNCIRQEEGFCSYTVTESQEGSFRLSNSKFGQINCKNRPYLLIPRPHLLFAKKKGGEGNNSDMNCGSRLAEATGATMPSSVTSDRTTPFAVGVRTVTSEDLDMFKKPILIDEEGFSVKYVQNPC
ncbi:uncharacterized protein LOC131880908 [Tigriopus californicus]|nr:uncharacterized protein LOC131880908 [Tigriopus californicus]